MESDPRIVEEPVDEPARIAQRHEVAARDRLGLEAETIPGGHLVALSDPRGLVDRLLDDPRV